MMVLTSYSKKSYSRYNLFLLNVHSYAFTDEFLPLVPSSVPISMIFFVYLLWLSFVYIYCVL